jgi:DNA-binding NtrC family response regulator
MLAEYFAKIEAQRSGREPQTVDTSLSAFLQRYAFPGNLEELRDIMSAAVRREIGPVLRVSSLSPYLRERIAGHFNAQDYELRSLAEAAQDHVRRTVYRVRGDHQRAASVLGISRAELEEHLKD